MSCTQRPLDVRLDLSSYGPMAELIRDKVLFEKHWNTDLERWFQQGIETPGIVLIKAHAQRIKYWDGEEEGEVKS